MENFNRLQIYIREKSVSWCTHERVRFLSCYKRVKGWKKENQNFQRFKELNP